MELLSVATCPWKKRRSRRKKRGMREEEGKEGEKGGWRVGREGKRKR